MPSALGVVRSTAQTTLAISSRKNATSSIAGPAVFIPSVGGTNSVSRSSGSPVMAVVRYIDHGRWNGFVSGPTVGATSDSTPNVSRTRIDVIVTTDPTGTSSGTTNQSSPYTRAKSVSSIRTMSVLPACTPAKLTRPSSISQWRWAGMPG